MTALLWLEDELARDPERVGGKAASLAALAASHRVPSAFVVPASALADGLTPLLREAVGDAYATLGEPPVAVRSSAVDEDGVAASFAGQHDTYLNVVGAEAVVAAIERCVASATSERALAYRRANGLAVDGIRIAVLVQELVAADVSAVVFSANPVTGSRDEIVINASFGLGESIVSGTVTPDLLVVSRADLTVRERRIAEKRVMTIAAPDGAREVPVPAPMRNRAAVGDEQAVEMARLALELEAAVSHPVDVECAYREDALFLLQARPITTLH